jgi:hypothetical protein
MENAGESKFFLGSARKFPLSAMGFLRTQEGEIPKESRNSINISLLLHLFIASTA